MIQYVDPKSFGLSTKTIVEEVDSKTLAIVIKRKSRIIMTDGKKILKNVENIKKLRPEMDVILKTNTPLCSKTLDFFKENDLKVITD